MAIYKKSFTLRIEEECLDKMKVIAAKYKRSINAQIEYLIEQCISEYEKQNGKVKTLSD